MTTNDASNAMPLAKLDAMIERVRMLPERVIAEAAQDVAALVRRELAVTIGAGQTPTGEAWAARKSDGGRPLANALEAVRVGVTDGSVVFVFLTGPEARHHRGWVRGGIERQIIPTTLPPAWVPKIQAILAQRFQAAAADGGGGIGAK
jgi:hypothetical protein